jgi:hypothetical protein
MALGQPGPILTGRYIATCIKKTYAIDKFIQKLFNFLFTSGLVYIACSRLLGAGRYIDERLFD